MNPGTALVSFVVVVWEAVLLIAAGALAACVMAVGYAGRFESSAILDFTFRILLLAGFVFCLLRFFVPRQSEGRTE